MVHVTKRNLLGIGISASNYAEASKLVQSAAIARQSLTVTALAVHGVMTGALDPMHRRRLNALDMVVPDGQPVRWALNLLFKEGLRDRVYGPNLMLRLCEMAQVSGLSIGLYGNKREVLEELRRNLAARYPELKFAALMPSRFGRVSPEEQAALAAEIAESGCELVFIGLGCPRQEVWLFENRALLNMPMIAVGAAFDFHAKQVAQAPSWMQDRGLEWVFRLIKEPKRLWRRYLLLNPLFLSMLAMQKIGLRRFQALIEETTVPYEGYA